MMKHNKQTFSLFGGLESITEQDFHYGAKAESYSLQPPEYVLKDEAVSDPYWPSTSDLLCENFSPFEDVLLPNTLDANTIQPNELLKDDVFFDESFNEIFSPQGLSANPLASPLLSDEQENIKNSFVKTEIVPTSSCSFTELLKFPNEPFESSPQIITYNKPIEINLKTVRIPSKPKVVKDENVVLKNTIQQHKKPDMTLKDALSLGCADNVFEELMEIVQPEEGLELQQFCSYIESDSDESSIFIDSPSSSIDSNGSSPAYLSPSSPYDSNDNEFCDGTSKSFVPSNTSSYPGENKKTKSTVKRLSGRKKLSAEEKKLKKMEQNKRAATRYRQKKKEEENYFLDKYKIEEKRNENLTRQYKNLKHEIRVMKKVMREFFIAKGMVSAKHFEN